MLCNSGSTIIGSPITIGKLAKAGNVKTDTIRYYESKGLLAAEKRSDSGYRIYSSQSVARLRFVKRAQALGFTLREVKEMLDLSENPEADCADIRDKAKLKIVEIEERIFDLNNIKNSLSDLSKYCPGEGKPLAECNILRHLQDKA